MNSLSLSSPQSSQQSSQQSDACIETTGTPQRTLRLVLACGCYSPYFRGGGEVANERLAHALVQAGYEVTVVTIGDADCREVVDNIPVIRLRSENLHWLYRSQQASSLAKGLWHAFDAINWKIAQRIGVLLDELKPDCLITSTIEDISTFTWREAKRRGIRTIDMLHSYYLLCYSGAMFQRGKNCAGQCAGCSMLCAPKRINSRYVDDVVGVSSFVLERHLAKGFFAGARKHVIPNIGFDSQQLDRQSIDKKLDKPPIDKKQRDEPYIAEQQREKNASNKFEKKMKIGYLGRLHPTKGVHVIIEAIAKSARADRFDVVIAGDGDENYREQLQASAAWAGVSIEFLGHVPPARLFAMIDYLVVPSLWQEPFGLVLTEAAHAGIPVLAARVGGMPEIVTVDVGLCFSDAAELATLLMRLLDARPQFSFASLERFDKKTVVNRWRELLEMMPAIPA